MQNELIDRNALCVPSDENDYDELVQFANDVMSADVITEQEIVMPYLEKITEEIQGLIDFEESCGDTTLGYQCLGVIKDKISELKGENKSEQADTEFNHEAFYEFLLNVINPNEMEKYRSMFLSNGEIVN